MRVSIDRNDAGFVAYNNLMNRGGRINVKLDGDALTRVITADEELGYVVRAKVDGAGRCIANYDRGEFVTEELHGKVEVEIV